MTWKACREEATASLVILGDDGDMCRGIVVGEPFLAEPGGQWRETKRFNIPIWDGEQITALSLSSKGFKRLDAKFNQLATNWIIVTRHGAKGDTGTIYSVELETATPDEIKASKKCALDYAKANKGVEDAIPLS